MLTQSSRTTRFPAPQTRDREVAILASESGRGAGVPRSRAVAPARTTVGKKAHCRVRRVPGSRAGFDSRGSRFDLMQVRHDEQGCRIYPNAAALQKIVFSSVRIRPTLPVSKKALIQRRLTKKASVESACGWAVLLAKLARGHFWTAGCLCH